MTSIKLKKSSVAGKIPTDSDLAHGELAINFQDGKLFYKDASNNVKAFMDSAAVDSLITTRQGLDSAGVKSVHFADNESLKFGNDSDFTITHTPNRTVLHDAGTGEIMVRTNQFRIRNPGNTETLAKFVQDGASELYHNNSKKIETKTTGATITGHLNADSATINGPVTISTTEDGGPVLNLISNDHSDATDFHKEGIINFIADNDADSQVTFAAIEMRPADITAGTEDGRINILTQEGGAGLTTSLMFASSKLILNHDNHEIVWNNTKGTSHEVALTVSTPSASRTITLPDASGTIALTSDIIPGIDSNGVTTLIDSDYVLSRSGISIPVLSEDSSLAFDQRLSFQAQTSTDGVLEVQPRMSVLDSAGTETLVNVNFTGGGGIDSAATVAIINDRFTTDVTFGGDVTFDSAGALFFDKSFKVLKFGDNYQAQFGDSADLKIYHDGSSSIIEDAGTGMLDVKASYFRVTNANGSKIAAQFSDFTGPAGGAQLFFDGTKRFETKDSGVNVIGQITADSATISGPATISDDLTLDSAGAVFFDKSDKAIKIGRTHKLILGSSTTNNNLEIYNDSSNVLLHQRGFGEFRIRSNTFKVKNKFGTEDLITAQNGGAVELYHNNNKKIETTDSGVNVTGNLLTDSATIRGGVLDIKNTGTQSEVRLFCEDANQHYVAVRAPAHSTFSGNVVLTLPSADGTIISTSNSNAPSTTTSAADADFVLIDDGGTMKKITPAN
ncbi:MAG: hypothetical protein CL669_06135, partial [Balneola sp.]|nr:hypothetical protein [Balneola sp.]